MIDRCVCQNKKFDELLALAKRNNWDVLTLAKETRCGLTCEWCVAYLKRAFATGRVVFDELLPKESLVERT
jgi:hypothetical protein